MRDIENRPDIHDVSAWARHALNTFVSLNERAKARRQVLFWAREEDVLPTEQGESGIKVLFQTPDGSLEIAEFEE